MHLTGPASRFFETSRFLQLARQEAEVGALPKQNRVTPCGELVATECRGTLMGDRGCLHDDQQRIRRAFACRRWIACVLEFRGRHRTVMVPGRYTELFFLDEATALAAGHRPCAECQHARYRLFRDKWAAANPDAIASAPPFADALDRVLHAERVGPVGEKRTYPAQPSELPTGTMVADASDRPFLVLGQALAPWLPGGYARAVRPPADTKFRVLTPGSIVGALSAGYPVEVHPSAQQAAGGYRAPRRTRLSPSRSRRMEEAERP
jgi:hypothetical protein